MMTAPSMIKLRQIQYFLAVADTLHFSQAAEKLFVTQPTLSHQIAELEYRVGTPLFDRSGKSVRLTEAGHLFRAYAKRTLSELEAGCNALSELAGLSRGSLRIGVTQSFVRKLLPPLLGEFIESNPAITLNVDELTASEIEHRLSEGLIDLGIAFAPAVLEDTEVEPLLEERLLLVMRQGHPLASRRHVRFSDLSENALALLGKEFSTRRLLDQYFEQAKVTPHAVCETNCIDVMLGVVRNSNIVAIVPESAIEKTPDIRVLPLLDPVPIRVSALLWSKHNFKTAAARAFAQLARRHFPSKLPLA